jgi:hypothetical protein
MTPKEKELKKLKSIIKKWKKSLVGKLIPYERTFKSE